MKRRAKQKSLPILAPKEQAKVYNPTEQEREAARRFVERSKHAAPAPRFKVKVRSNKTVIDADHPDSGSCYVQLCDMLATGEVPFALGLLHQIARVAQSGQELTASALNAMLVAIHEIAPRDPTEALLATQMVAIHNATMVAARRLNFTETIDQQDSASTMLNKLARTFATQVETLKKYRSTGEQSIRVQHVNVNAGQAIVGINQGGGGAHENKSQSHAPSEKGQSGSALLGHEQALPMPVSGPRREGPTCLPDARRRRGSTEGES